MLLKLRSALFTTLTPVTQCVHMHTLACSQWWNQPSITLQTARWACQLRTTIAIATPINWWQQKWVRCVCTYKLTQFDDNVCVTAYVMLTVIDKTVCLKVLKLSVCVWYMHYGCCAKVVDLYVCECVRMPSCDCYRVWRRRWAGICQPRCPTSQPGPQHGKAGESRHPAHCGRDKQCLITSNQTKQSLVFILFQCDSLVYQFRIRFYKPHADRSSFLLYSSWIKYRGKGIMI